MHRYVWSLVSSVVLLAALPAPVRAAPSALVLDDARAMPGWSIPLGAEFWRPHGSHVDPAAIAARMGRSFLASDAEIRARSPHYDALLDPRGARVETESASLRVSTREVRAGDEVMATRAAAPWLVVGDAAQRRLEGDAGVVEHLVAGEAGLEMTWILPAAPASDGPLTVVVDVEGMRPVGEAEDGHRFAHADHVMRIGHAVAVDSGGRRWPLASSVDAGVLRIEVDERILEEATYPLAIDPIVGPVNPVLPVPFIGTEASIAVADIAQFFLVAWTDTTLGNPNIRGAIVTPTGALVAAIWISGLTPDLESNPSVASDGNNFYVVWEERKAAGAPARVVGRGVTPAGGFLAAPFPIAGNFGNPSANAPDVTWDGANWVVGWHEGVLGAPADIRIAYLNPIGNAIVLALAPSPSPYHEMDVALAAIGPTVVVVWTDQRPGAVDNTNIWSATLVGGAVVLGPLEVSLPVDATFPPGSQVRADIDAAANGAGFLVTFTHRNSTGVDIMGVDLTAVGVPVGPWAIATTASVEDNSAVSRIRAAEFFVTWQDSTVGATLIDHLDVAAGTLVGAAPILTPARAPDVACLVSCFAVQEMTAGPAIWIAPVVP